LLTDALYDKDWGDEGDVGDDEDAAVEEAVDVDEVATATGPNHCFMTSCAGLF